MPLLIKGNSEENAQAKPVMSMWGEMNEPNQTELFGKNDPNRPPSSSFLLSPDFSGKVGKIIGGAGIHDLENLIMNQRVGWEILLIPGKVLSKVKHLT